MSGGCCKLTISAKINALSESPVFFLLVSLFSLSRESDHCTKCRPKCFCCKSWTFVFLIKCWVNITGHRSFLKVNKTRSTSTLPWVGVTTLHRLRWRPFTGYRDVSLNTQGFISSKSTQTVYDGNGNKIHICQFTSLSEQDYCLHLIGGCTDVPFRGTIASSPWGLRLSLSFILEKKRCNKTPVYLLLVLATWNENLLGIQDSVIITAYIYFSSAKWVKQQLKIRLKVMETHLKLGHIVIWED